MALIGTVAAYAFVVGISVIGIYAFGALSYGILKGMDN